MLTFSVTKKKFDDIVSGEDKFLYKEIKKYWTDRIQNRTSDTVLIKNGYSQTVPMRHADIVDIALIKTKCDSRYEIRISNVREIK